MTEEKIDFYDLKKKLGEFGVDEEDTEEALVNEKRKIKLIAWGLDNTRNKPMTFVNNIKTYVNTTFPGKVEVGDVWICSVEFSNTVYHAMPIYKVSPSFLMGLDANLRDDIIDTLWRRNRSIFEKDFAERYKDEVHNAAIEEVGAELNGIINELRGKVSYLENQLEQNRILSKSMVSAQTATADTIELGSYEEETCVELGSDVPQEPATEARSPRIGRQPSKIPNFYVTSAPGIPQIRTPERTESHPHSVFNVERKGEETICSESFTDHKYFVHMSPDGKMLVVRPNEFGSALCINGSIMLKGLGKVSPFTGPKKLTAEYNDRYEGLIVYL